MTEVREIFIWNRISQTFIEQSMWISVHCNSLELASVRTDMLQLGLNS
jgi:hypothetical protein